ncbi:unknown [Clostridium sp. CAG:921]|nr:unknown [Clostridium sp. CAG:921]
MKSILSLTIIGIPKSILLLPSFLYISSHFLACVSAFSFIDIIALYVSLYFSILSKYNLTSFSYVKYPLSIASCMDVISILVISITALVVQNIFLLFINIKNNKNVINIFIFFFKFITFPKTL